MVLTLWQRDCELGNTEDKKSCTELGEEQMCIFNKKAARRNNKENQINWQESACLRSYWTRGNIKAGEVLVIYITCFVV